MAVAYVSGQSGFNSGGSPVSSLTVTVGTAVSPGSAVCILVGGLPSVGNVSNYLITDNGSGATYHAVDNTNDGSGYFAALFYAVNVQGSPTQFVIHAGSGTINFPAMLIDTFSGVSAVSPAIDGFNSQTQQNPGTATNAISSSTFSPATSGDLIWGVTVDEGGLGGETAGTGFTLAQNQASSFISEYKLSGATGSQAATFTNATNGGGPGFWLTGGFALKAAVPTTLSPPQKQWAWVGNAPALAYLLSPPKKQWAWVPNAPALNPALQTVKKQWVWVANAPSVGSATTLQTVQKAWAWVGNAPTIGTVLQTVQKAWQWVGNSPELNHALATVQKQWVWAKNTPTLSHVLTTVQKQWEWLANAPTLIPSTIINPPKALWAWVARAPILSGGNIPGKIKAVYNVIMPAMWGIIRGETRDPMY